jgi:hypothetical protein
MANQTVSVIFSEADGGTLSLAPAQETVVVTDPTDWVNWIPSSTPPFPPGSTLLIKFEEPFGPFQVVRAVGPQNLLAKGNTANVDLFSYFLFLVLDTEPEPQSLIKAGPFTIDNQCSEANFSPWVQVNCTELVDGQWDPVVDQDPVFLHTGDNALMEITGLPQDFFVSFLYPTGSTNLGPFSTYFMTRQNGTGSLRMYGATFNSETEGLVSYGIRVWNEDGVLVGTKDPSIDGLGKPPGT